MSNPILELAEVLLENVKNEKANPHTQQLLILAAETIIKQYELLLDAGKMVDQSIKTLNMIIDKKISTIH